MSNACSSIEQGHSLKAKGASLSLGGVDSKQKASAQSEAMQQKSIVSTKEKEPTYKVVGSSNNEIWEFSLPSDNETVTHGDIPEGQCWEIQEGKLQIVNV